MRRLKNNLSKELMSCLIPVLRRLPPRTAHRIVARIGRIEYRLLPRLRRGCDSAVERGSLYFGQRWDRPELGVELAGNMARWRARDILLDRVPRDELTNVIHVSGRENLDRAHALGEGIVLLGNHFGAHMTAPHWLSRENYHVRLYMERPRRVSRFLSRQFQAEGPLGQKGLFISRGAGTTEGAAAVMKAARVLKAGMIVYLAGDVRWNGAHTAPGRFLGKMFQFSTTWVMLAAMTGAPVVPVFCVMNDDGSHLLEFLPYYYIPEDVKRTGATAIWVQKCLDTIEGYVREYPSNSNDYFFWDDPEWDKPATSTIITGAV
jgi:lauroyl/myristoyl acyltransferase